jgi:hypothetical protein
MSAAEEVVGFAVPVLPSTQVVSLVDCISSGWTECSATLSRCESRPRPGREVTTDVTAKMVIYKAFVEGKTGGSQTSPARFTICLGEFLEDRFSPSL